MTDGDPHVTRRKALAGIGAVGFATMGMGLGRRTGSFDEYPNYTYAESDAPARLLVGWRSTYNGVVDEASIDPDDEIGDVQLIDLDDVLPGDEGTASVGLRLEDDGEMVSEGVRVWMQIDANLDDDDPNALAANEALAARIELDIRYDDGILGIGGCGGAESEFADLGEPIFSGTLAEAGSDGDLATGFQLDPGVFDNGCLGPDDRCCLAFAWSFPPGLGNVGKGGTVDFDVTFRAVSCDRSENPFPDSENGGSA